MNRLIKLCIFAFSVVSLISCADNAKAENEETSKERNALLMKAGQMIYNDTLRPEAMKMLKDGMKKYPYSDLFPGTLAIGCLLDGDTVRAERYYQRSLAITDSLLRVHPTHYDTLQRAVYLIMLGREKEGQDFFRQASSLPFERSGVDMMTKENLIKGFTRSDRRP